MNTWHTYQTTHCCGGWAIHLAGEAGYALEKHIGGHAAAALIYQASAGYVPDFYVNNDDAMRDSISRARRQSTP